MSLVLDTNKILTLSASDEFTLEKNLSVAMKEFFVSASESEIKDIFAHAQSVTDSTL